MINNNFNKKWNDDYDDGYEEFQQPAIDGFRSLYTNFKGGGGGGDTTQIQKSEPWAEAKPYYNRLYQRGESAVENPMEFYGGNTVAGFNDNIVDSQNWMLNYGRDAQGLLGTGAQQLGNIVSGQYMDPNYGAGNDPMQGILSGTNLNPNYGAGTDTMNATLSGDYLSADSNPYLQQNVQRSTQDIIDTFQEDALPSIRTGAQNSGQYGGSRQGVIEARAYDDAMENAMNTAASMYGANYESERGRQNEALNLDQSQRQANQANQLAAMGQYSGDYQQGIGNVMNALGGMGSYLEAGTIPGQIQGDVGAQQRELEQARINEDIARWDFNESQDWANLQNMAALLNGGSFFSNSSVTNTPQNNLSTLLGGAATVGGLMSK